jgi:O-antigen ligase
MVMLASRLSILSSKASLALVLLCILLVILMIGGGASRAEVLGQVVVRGTAWLLLIVAVLFSDFPDMRAGRPVVMLLVLTIALPLLQLVPLPSSIWTMLPERHLIGRAANFVGEPQSWQLWSIVPTATMNAASSLIVPTVTLWLTLSLSEDEREHLPSLLLGLVLASALVGLAQISSFTFDNPLINETPQTVSGTFANRNHFALHMAIGCVLAIAWAAGAVSARAVRGIVALGLMLLFILATLVSGSRVGVLLCGAALAMGALLSGTQIRSALTHYPRWVFPALVAGIVAITALLVFASVAADRAVSIDRMFAADPGQDMRTRGLPTVLAMVRDYFPFGTGLGGFDPMFRLREPFHLLKPTYFNHAHNDFIEVVLDTGLPGLLLLLAALGWWGLASVRAWRAGSRAQAMLPKLGSAILLLVLLASIVDYPTRTPTIMAWTVIAAVWLSGHSRTKRVNALPYPA